MYSHFIFHIMMTAPAHILSITPMRPAVVAVVAVVVAAAAAAAWPVVFSPIV
jgi:hypothetical protein